MKLSLPEDSVPVKEMFERFFATESTSARVRAAEPNGFDAALWRELVALDAPFMRLSDSAGGGGMSLFDTCLMMEQAGRRLAPAPLAEAVVAIRILGEIGVIRYGVGLTTIVEVVTPRICEFGRHCSDETQAQTDSRSSATGSRKSAMARPC